MIRTLALFGSGRNASRYPKDGINRRIVNGEAGAINPFDEGTKVAVWYSFDSIEPLQLETTSWKRRSR